MKVAGLVMFSSALLLGGCAAYPDGPAYGGGYPTVYDDPGYAAYGYGGPVVQPGVAIGGGYYYGPGPGRYWDDGPGWRRPPPGGWNNRPHDGPPHGHGGQPGGGPPHAGGGGPQGAQPQAGGAPLPKAVGGVRPRPPQPAPAGGGGGGGGNHGGGNQRGYLGPIGG
ncbi:hypothetical protein [Caballeronia sp. Lep1P3]|uniref:hypothetical protein n=1 Tax=Caballeronia sp. Lep1P3 TaxID=2878150 RepID=UPI001FD2754E|nr:hypothetical protein [Caballeronia sp. Lep1P3]